MSEVKLDKTGLTTPSISLGNNILSSEDNKLLWNGEEFKSSGGGHNVGEQWISMDGTMPLGGIPFNGQTLNIADYQDLYNWAKDNGRIKTESEWQTLKTNNNSNVAYYSQYSDTQFRMPIFRGYLKADNGSGYIKQGLPDHTHTITSGSDITNEARGNTHTSGMDTVSNYNASSGYNFSSSKASVSNSIYGSSSNVTPETSKVLVGVYAFNTIVNAAIIDSSQKLSNHIYASNALNHFNIGYDFADAFGALLACRSINYTEAPGAFQLIARNDNTSTSLTGKPGGDLTWDSKPIIRLVASWKSGTSWYRKYSDGFIEQGGRFTYSQTNSAHTKLNFNISFSNTNYLIVGSGYRTDGNPNQGFATFRDFNTSYCNTAFWDDSSSNPGIINWYACGY